MCAGTSELRNPEPILQIFNGSIGVRYQQRLNVSINVFNGIYGLSVATDHQFPDISDFIYGHTQLSEIFKVYAYDSLIIYTRIIFKYMFSY